MYVRSSVWLYSVAAAACLMGGGAVWAQPAAPPGAAQLTANDLPDLGDPMPAPATAPRLVLAKLDLNTPVSRLCANPRAKAVLDSDLPGLTTRPEFPFFKSMSLNTLKRMSRGQMSDADLAKVQAELARLDETAATTADQ